MATATIAKHQERHHHRLLLSSLMAMVIGGVLAAGGYWAYFNFYARFQPVTITKNQADIERLLAEGDWVSPGRTGPALYMVAYRDCQACTDYMRDEFPKLAAANVDTRVIVFARADREGLQQSTPIERATVAELWINRDWNLFAKWMSTPRRDWSAEGIKPAEKDWARRAVVASTRDYVNQLFPLVKSSGLSDDYPLLIWRDHDGFLKACACTDSRSFHFIRADLGVEKPLIQLPVLDLPWLTGSKPKPASDTVPQPAAPAPQASATTPAPAAAAPAATAPGATDTPAAPAPTAAAAPAPAQPTPVAKAAKPAAQSVPGHAGSPAKTVFY
ncbi:MAG: hypothetical protein JSR45_13110 [Proteobacteria bacterium]|nr:hypothetical protein [Pseudomonadota bacterium]